MHYLLATFFTFSVHLCFSFHFNALHRPHIRVAATVIRVVRSGYTNIHTHVCETRMWTENKKNRKEGCRFPCLQVEHIRVYSTSWLSICSRYKDDVHIFTDCTLYLYSYLLLCTSVCCTCIFHACLCLCYYFYENVFFFSFYYYFFFSFPAIWLDFCISYSYPLYNGNMCVCSVLQHYDRNAKSTFDDDG